MQFEYNGTWIFTQHLLLTYYPSFVCCATHSIPFITFRSSAASLHFIPFHSLSSLHSVRKVTIAKLHLGSAKSYGIALISCHSISSNSDGLNTESIQTWDKVVFAATWSAFGVPRCSFSYLASPSVVAWRLTPGSAVQQPCGQPSPYF